MSDLMCTYADIENLLFRQSGDFVLNGAHDVDKGVSDSIICVCIDDSRNPF